MITHPHIVVLCATDRGYACLDVIRELRRDARISVVTFREERWEPPFFEKIRTYCAQNHCEFYESKRLDNGDFVREWEVNVPTILLAISWRYMIPEEVFSLPQLGAYVFHDSMLPGYRGFSPTVWAMINGEASTGATLLRMHSEMDAGEIVEQIEIPIGDDETIKEVMENVTSSYLTIIKRNLIPLLNGNVTTEAQDGNEATFCCKRLPADNRIDWCKTSEEIYNLIRAVTRPYTGAFTFLENKMVKVWSARKVDNRRYVGSVPGRVVEVIAGVGVTVLTGDGALMLCEVEIETGTSVNASIILDRLSYTLV